MRATYSIPRSVDQTTLCGVTIGWMSTRPLAREILGNVRVSPISYHSTLPVNVGTTTYSSVSAAPADATPSTSRTQAISPVSRFSKCSAEPFSTATNFSFTPGRSVG